MPKYLLLFFLQGSEGSSNFKESLRVASNPTAVNYKESLHDTNNLSIKTHGNGSANNSGNIQSAVTPRSSSLSSSQLLLQRKQFAESQIGRNSFQKLLEPSSSQIPGIAPYRVVLGDVKEKVPF